MAPNLAVRAERVGKRYLVGGRPPASFREAVSGITQRSPFRKDRAEPFWALRGLSFELERGDALGVVGRNGAGKSTLFKVLSRVTEPTEGRIELVGRVGSLLEVGTGFHPDLSGRENVFLNGAILGMRRAEIRKKFDEIVAFAEVERFIDTPVKRYSSGMYMRLAFSVAAHLETEILIVDEVLAVGDLAFQRKCLGKMGSVARDGRTVLFVSHNLGAVGQLCTKAIWLERGQLRYGGGVEETIKAYLRSVAGSAGSEPFTRDLDPAKAAQIVEAGAVNAEGVSTTEFDCDEPVLLRCKLLVKRRTPGMYGYLEISREDGTPVLVSDSLDAPPNPLGDLDAGSYDLEMEIPRRSIGAGTYTAYLNLASPSADHFNIDTPGVFARFSLSDTRTTRGNQRRGFLSTIAPWTVRREGTP